MADRHGIIEALANRPRDACDARGHGTEGVTSMHAQSTDGSRFRSTGEAAAYLAAMIDGEGHVDCAIRDGYLRRVVTIVNTEIELIEACEDALDVLGVRHARHTWTMTTGRRRQAWRVYIGEPSNLRRLAAVVKLQSPRKRDALARAAEHRGRAERLSPEEREATFAEVRRLYEHEGMSAAMIAGAFGRDETTIYQWLRLGGGTVRTRSEARYLALSRS